MPTVAALIPDPAVQHIAANQVGTVASVHLCDTMEDLASVLARHAVDVVVADLWDGTGPSTLQAFGVLRRVVPRLPIVLYFVPTPAALREALDIIAFGRGVTLALQGHEHLGLVLRPLLHAPRVASAGETLSRHIIPLVPRPFRPFFAVSMLKASPRLRVATAASWSGLSRRTLERSLRRARLPSAADVLGSSTALHAAWWLDVQGWSPKHVIAQMQFSHPSALTRVLQRHFHCSLKSLHDEGGFQGLLYKFEARLVGEVPTPPKASAN